MQYSEALLSFGHYNDNNTNNEQNRPMVLVYFNTILILMMMMIVMSPIIIKGIRGITIKLTRGQRRRKKGEHIYMNKE